MLGFNQSQNKMRKYQKQKIFKRLLIQSMNYLSTLRTVAYFALLVVFLKLNWVISASKHSFGRMIWDKLSK